MIFLCLILYAFIDSLCQEKYDDMEKVDEENKQQQNTSKGRLLALGSDPWLLFVHGKNEAKHTIYKISDNDYHVKSITCMREKYVRASYHGWMVLESMYSDDCCLFNPASMEEIQLSPLESSFYHHICVLSSPLAAHCCSLLIPKKMKE